MLNVNEHDTAVSDYLKSIRVKYDVNHTAEMLHDDWPHDLFYVVFSRPGQVKSGGGYVVKPAAEGFEYKTGIGHRVTPPQSKSGYSPRSLSPGQRRDAKALRELIGKSGLVGAKHATARRPVSIEYVTLPTQASVLCGLILDSSAEDENFESWADSYGYDSDSLKALEMYRACLANAKKLHNIFTCEQLEHLRELLEDY